MLGQKYTAVMLDNGSVGVALSQVNSSDCSGEQTAPPARPAGRAVKPLVGASVPLLPTAFRGTPVTWPSVGLQFNRYYGERVLEVVARGGGRREFIRFLSKANVRLEQTAISKGSQVSVE